MARFAMPASRRAERLFGETARRSNVKVVKLEGGGQKPDYDPAGDNCLDAYVRVICTRAKPKADAEKHAA